MADNITLSNQTNNTEPGSSTGSPPIPSLSTGDIVNIVFLCILAVMIVFANSLMIGAFYVNTRLQKRTNFLLISLAVADLLVGTLSLPLWLYMSITASYVGRVYTVYVIFDVICGVSSILNLTVISLERCYALIRPVKHRNITKRVFVAVIAVPWILATLAGTSREFLDMKYMKFYGVTVTVVFFFVPLAIILGAYGTMFHLARAHARGREVRSFKKDLRTAMTVALVIGLFVICLTPFFAFNFANSVCIQKRWMTSGCLGMLKLPLIVNKISKWLQYGNSVCNPIIYGLRNEEFRRTFRVILLRLCCKKVRITEYDNNLHEGVRKARSARRRREVWRENVQLQSVRIIPSPEPHLKLSDHDTRENHSEGIQSSNPIKLESPTRNSLPNCLKELNKDHVFPTFSSGVTSAVVAPLAACCNQAFEHDQTETGNYPVDDHEVIPKQHSLTENIDFHKRATEVSVQSNDTSFHLKDSAVAAPSAAYCNRAFEHDQTKTGNYPGDDEVIPKQHSLTENINVHKRSKEVSLQNNETRRHFTDSKSLENEKDSNTAFTLASFDKKRSSVSEIIGRPSDKTALNRLKLKLRSQSFP